MGSAGGDFVSSYKNRERLLSLDVLRGLTLVGMILVNSMAVMKYDVGLKFRKTMKIPATANSLINVYLR